jgi:hypothetical protein
MARESGPTSWDRSAFDGFVQIVPQNIAGLDQIDFPLALPFLQARLAVNGDIYIFEHLEMNEMLDTIGLGEAFDQPSRCSQVRRTRSFVTPMYSVPFLLLARMYT